MIISNKSKTKVNLKDSTRLQKEKIPSASRISKIWRIGRFPISIVLGLLALYVVAGRTDELSAVGSYLDRVNWFWIGPGVVFEMASMIAFAKIQGSLARSSGTPVKLSALLGITFAGNSITNSLPAGPAFASFFAFRQYKRVGVDATLASWVLFGLLLASSITLAGLAFVGLIVAIATGSGSFGVANTIVISLLVISAIGGSAILLLRKRHIIEKASLKTLKISQAIFHWPHYDARDKVNEIAIRLHQAIPSRHEAVVALSWSLMNWLLDMTCLVVSFWAVGVGVPWSGLLLAYGAGQLAANLPVTPGGLGVVEGSLEVALVAFGGNQTSTVAVILLYRLISFWLLLPIGWVWWLAIHRQDAKQRKSILSYVQT